MPFCCEKGQSETDLMKGGSNKRACAEAGKEGERRKDSSFLGQITAPSQNPSLSRLLLLLANSLTREWNGMEWKGGEPLLPCAVTLPSPGNHRRSSAQVAASEDSRYRPGAAISGRRNARGRRRHGRRSREVAPGVAVPVDPRSPSVRSRGRELPTA